METPLPLPIANNFVIAMLKTAVDDSAPHQSSIAAAVASLHFKDSSKSQSAPEHQEFPLAPIHP
jgi:hypothetical protein